MGKKYFEEYFVFLWTTIWGCGFFFTKQYLEWWFNAVFILFFVISAIVRLRRGEKRFALASVFFAVFILVMSLVLHL